MSETWTGEGRVLFPRLVRTREQLAEEVAHLRRHDHLVVDVETTFAPHPSVNEVLWVGLSVPDRVTLIPMGQPNGRLLVPAHKAKVLPPEHERRVLKNGTLSQAKKTVTVPAAFAPPGEQLRPDIVFEALEPLFFSDRVKIGHNVKFDIQSIAKYYGGELMPGPYADTMIMAHVLNENLISYGLKDLVMDWLRIRGAARKDFYPNLGKSGVQNHAMDEVARYLAKDVWYALLLYRTFRRLLDKTPELATSFDVEMALLPVLMTMEMNGVHIDQDLLAKKAAVLIQERDATAGRIWSICGEQFPLTNDNKKRHYLFGKKKDGGQGLKPLSFTEKTNTPQLNQAMLEHYAPTNELAAELLEWGEREKLISTFVVGLNERMVKGRLHTSFNQHRVKTNRLSSSNPNLQQIPRGHMRDVFTADDGHLLVVADYDQVELRCAAYLSRDAEMVRVFRDGLDIHAQAAAAMLEIPLEEVTKDQRQVGKAQPDDALVLTNKGYTRIDHLSVGDYVVDPVSGMSVPVDGVFPQGERPVYRVTFSDGATVECDLEHLWKVRSQGGWQIKPLSEIKDRVRLGKGYRYEIPLVDPVKFKPQDLPVPPYVLGVLLGDGNITGPSVLFSSADKDIVDRVREELPRYTVAHHGGYDYSITMGPHRGERGPHSESMQAALRLAGVWGKGAHEKSIPETYLYSSVTQRTALLQGLLDTDGYAGGGYVEFCSCSEQLARDVQWLVRSLGGVAKLKHGTTAHRDRYRVHIAIDTVEPFWLTRKALAYSRTRAVKRKITSVDYVGMKPTRCISVASADHLYVTEDFIVTHNTQNFGTLYGAGPQKVAFVANTTVERAEEFIDRYYEQFSGLSAWKSDVLIAARRTGSRARGTVPYAVIPPYGRRRRLPDLYSNDTRDRAKAERQVVNSIVQGFAACIMKLALIDLHEALRDTPYKLLLNVHDEVVIQAPEAEVEEAQKLLVAVMEGVTYEGSPILGDVPLTADGGIAYTWNGAK